MQDVPCQALEVLEAGEGAAMTERTSAEASEETIWGLEVLGLKSA